MDAIGLGPVRVGSIVWQPGPGNFAFTAVAKVTFRLTPGESPLDDEPEDIYTSDSYWDDNRSRSLVQATDLSPGKACPEVLLVGSAHAPGQIPVSSFHVRMQVGDIDKSIRVHGDRWFAADGSPSEPQKIMRLPLSWERAAGGPDTDNPVGVRMGAAARVDAWGRAQAPNLEPAGSPPANRFHPILPVGFGPVAPAWRPRSSRLALCGASWDPEKWAEAPLPAGMDYGYWNVAPADQHLSALRGDETIFLENLDRRHAQLSTRLARLEIRARVDWSNGGSRGLPLSPDTMTIDTDRGVATLVFRGSMLLDQQRPAGRAVVEVVRAGAQAPLRGEPVGAAAPASTAVGPSAQPATTEDVRVADVEMTLVPALGAALPPALPFSDAPPFQAAAALMQPAVAGEAPGADAETTLTPALGVVPPLALPFADAALDAAIEGTLFITPVSLSVGSAAAGETIFAGLERVEPALPFSSRAEGRVEAVMPALVAESEEAAEIETDTIAPPPMIGPLANERMASPAAGVEDRASAVVGSTGPVPLPAIALDEELTLPLADVPLERCAAIDASIAHRPQDTDAILRAARLEVTTWKRVLAHHAAAIREETKRGKTGLLRAYDAAYVKQIETERGTITVDEYARMSVAAEREGQEILLGEAKVPRPSMMRIQRAWITRIAADVALGTRVREAISRTRAEDSG